jgi:uncharacterized protein YbaP (TraB family)
MKKPLQLLLGLSLCFTAVYAQPVWKITKDDASIYLGGTIHVLRAKDFPLPPEFDTAFAAATKVYFETDFARVRSPEMQQIVMEQGTFTDGSTLESTLSASAWEQVKAYASSRALPLEQVSRMKPWFLSLMMAVIEMQKLGISQEGVDAHYFDRLAREGKTAGELESFEDQVKFITTMGAGHESEMLQQSIEDLNELPALLESMIQTWRQGDMTKLDRVMLEDMRTKHPKIYESLLVERNRNWMPRIEALFRTPEVEFVLVGAAHLAGRDGLLAQLKARGYAIEQLKAPVAAAQN